MAVSWRNWTGHLCLYFLGKALFSVLQFLPRKASLLLGEALGALVFHLSTWNRKTAIENISTVYGNQRCAQGLAKKAFSELGRNLADALKLTSTEDLARVVRVEGEENLRQALDKERGAICITGHLGCWELMPQYLASRGVNVYPITQQVYDRRVDSLIRKVRQRRGMKSIDRKSGLREALRVLRRGEALGILMDQGSGKDGVAVDFFGRLTRFPKGPVSLSLKTGAPIVPMVTFRSRGETHVIRIGKEISLRRASDAKRMLKQGTQLCAKALEDYVRRHPAQWVWNYPRWGSSQ